MKPAEIKRIREKLNLDRKGFAEVFGLAGYQSVMNIEIGFRNPSKLLIVVLKTLDALPVSKANDLIVLMRKHGKQK